MTETYCLIAFDSPHAAIRAEEHLKSLPPAVVPTLRAITASCGMSLRVKTEQTETARALLAESNLNPALYRFYRVEDADGGTRCTRVDE